MTAKEKTKSKIQMLEPNAVLIIQVILSFWERRTAVTWLTVASIDSIVTVGMNVQCRNKR
jgi:hypothetical protein